MSMERTNIRYVTPEQLPEPMDLAVMDLSFISLRLVLPAVRALSVRGAGRSDVPTVGWTLGPDETATLPAALHAAEGETLELFAPGWRDASDGRPDELPFLVSLLEENAFGETTTDRIALVRERPDGALLVGPLPAGDYRLFLRALGRGVAIRVTRPFPAAAA